MISGVHDNNIKYNDLVVLFEARRPHAGNAVGPALTQKLAWYIKTVDGLEISRIVLYLSLGTVLSA